MGCHFFLQGIFPTQGSNPWSPELAGGFFTTETPGKPVTLNHFTVSKTFVVKISLFPLAGTTSRRSPAAAAQL